MMEITAGPARGILLRAPAGLEVRPTSVRARRALFDSLGPLDGITFADLCAGSGAMGIEAASRGARTVIFAESAAESLRVIRENCSRAAAVGLETDFLPVRGTLPDSIPLLVREPRPDLIFADPPYRVSLALLQSMIGNAAFTRWASDSTLYWELPSGGGLLPPPVPWKMKEIRTFGSVKFLVLCVND